MRGFFSSRGRLISASTREDTPSSPNLFVNGIGLFPGRDGAEKYEEFARNQDARCKMQDARWARARELPFGRAYQAYFDTDDPWLKGKNIKINEVPLPYASWPWTGKEAHRILFKEVSNLLMRARITSLTSDVSSI